MQLNSHKLKLFDSLSKALIVLQLFQAFFYYTNEVYRLYFYVLITVWIYFKVLCTVFQCILIKKFSVFSFLKSLYLSFFQSELITLFLEKYQNSEKGLTLGFVSQTFVYALPTLIINSQILATDDQKNNVFQIFLQVIYLVDLIYISLCNVFYLMYKNEIKKQMLNILQYFVRYFIFLSLFSSLLSSSYIIIASWIGFHFFMAINVASKVDDIEIRVECFIEYMLQLDVYLLKKQGQNDKHIKIDDQSMMDNHIQNNQTNFQNKNLEVRSWVEVLYLCMIQVNIITFLIIKLLINPIESHLDYLIFILFITFSIQQIIRTVIILYKRGIIIINFQKIISWKYGRLISISKIMTNLSKNLINEGNLFINIESLKQSINNINKLNIIKSQKNIQNIQSYEKDLIWINQKQFFVDLKEIQSGIKIATMGKFNSLHLLFYDKSYNVQIIFSFNNNHLSQQKIILKSGFDVFFVIQLLDFIQFIIDPNSPLNVESEEIQLLKVRLLSIRFQKDNIIQNKEYQKITSGILSCNYQALAYYKNISDIIPLNPSLILYDLFDDNLSY